MHADKPALNGKLLVPCELWGSIPNKAVKVKGGTRSKTQADIPALNSKPETHELSGTSETSPGMPEAIAGHVGEDAGCG